jgi:hypothetical protein
MSNGGAVLASGTAVLKALETLRGLNRGERGRRRKLLAGLGELLDATLLHTRDGADARAVLATLDPSPMAELLGSDLDFRRLKRGPVAAGTTRGVGFYRRYVGWSTERLYAHIYRKTAELKRLATLPENPRIRLDQRLRNLQKLIVLFIWHVGAEPDC